MPQVALHPGYVPHRHQRRAHASGKRFLGMVAGVRGGKTKSGAVEFVRRIYKDYAAGKRRPVSGVGRHRRPAQHYWVVAPTSQLLREPLRYLFEALPLELIEGHYPSDGSLWLAGDILVELRSADNPLHLVSTGLDGLWMDEAARMKADAWRGQLRQRLTDRAGWGIATTTPLGRNWFYEDWACRADPHHKAYDPDFACIAWKTSDNPAIPAQEVADAKRQLPLRYYLREYEASFEAFSGTVFDEYDRALHVASLEAFRAQYNLQRGTEVRRLFRNVVAGVDWGWNSPSAIVVIGEMAPRNWVVLEESYGANRIVFDPRLKAGTMVAEAKRLQQKYGITMFYADPSRPSDIYDFTRAGIPTLGADNEILFGVRKVGEALHPVEEGIHADGSPKLRAPLRILDHCTNLLGEIPQYVYAQTRDKSGFVDLPAEGQMDHAIDALRYGLVELMKHEMPDDQRGGSSRGSNHQAAGPAY